MVKSHARAAMVDGQFCKQEGGEVSLHAERSIWGDDLRYGVMLCGSMSKCRTERSTSRQQQGNDCELVESQS